MDALALLWGTLCLRPCVFVFLAWAASAMALAVACFVLNDVIIDPLAVQGGRWFLGKSFECPQGGASFGVPLSHLAGWAVGGTVGLGLYSAGGRRWETRGLRPPAHAPAALNLTIIFTIGEVALGLAGLLVAGLPAAALVGRVAGLPPGRAARAWQRETSHP